MAVLTHPDIMDEEMKASEEDFRDISLLAFGEMVEQKLKIDSSMDRDTPAFIPNIQPRDKPRM